MLETDKETVNGVRAFNLLYGQYLVKSKTRSFPIFWVIIQNFISFNFFIKKKVGENRKLIIYINHNKPYRDNLFLSTDNIHK